MGLVIDGTTISTSANVYVDGVAVNNVYIDGTLVWTKASSGSWKTAWSGNIILMPYGLDKGILGVGTVYDKVSGTITGNIIQAEGIYYQDLFDTGWNPVDSYTEDIIPNKSTTNPTAMGTWYPSSPYYDVCLYQPTYMGNNLIEISADTAFDFVGSELMFSEYFVITAIYYYS